MPQSKAWKKDPHEFAFVGKGWHVLVMATEDEPDDAITDKFPKAKHVAYVTLEPIGAGKAGYKMLEEVVRELSRQTGGVWVDSNGEPYSHDEGSFT
ncbi:MAG TPA: hypothetical protein VH280_15640 [Verrucomicrobiae bacterium]|nr:hypothetical protein [Verrucomicrobiae bacterium]